MRRVASLALALLAGTCVILMTAWAALAVWWSDIPSAAIRLALAAGLVLATVLGFALSRRRRLALLVHLACFGLLVAWWSRIAPTNDREWQPDVAVLPYADIQGELVTVHNIRDFAYRTETDYQIRYYDKAFDLSRLDSLDIIAVYWMGDAIAHVMLSFGFGEKDYVCVSIETRKAAGQDYSSLKGFFKQYELTYVVADERDLIRLRTAFRKPPEDVYLYRTRVSREAARRLFLEYIKKINSLRDQPEFYNTLTTNCTTNIVRHIQAFGGKAAYNWKILLSGYAPQYAYGQGVLDDSLPFEALRQRSFVNAMANAIGDAPDFSVRLRQGLPRPAPPAGR